MSHPASHMTKRTAARMNSHFTTKPNPKRIATSNSSSSTTLGPSSVCWSGPARLLGPLWDTHGHVTQTRRCPAPGDSCTPALMIRPQGSIMNHGVERPPGGQTARRPGTPGPPDRPRAGPFLVCHGVRLRVREQLRPAGVLQDPGQLEVLRQARPAGGERPEPVGGVEPTALMADRLLRQPQAL